MSPPLSSQWWMDSNSKEISQITTTTITTTTTSQSEKKKNSPCYHIVVLLISCIFFIFLFPLLAFFFIFAAGLIEYREHSSGRMQNAIVEAPKEALPLDCRPSFGTTWVTKYKFRVNGTYNCKYTPGISDVDIFLDILFNCQAKDPSKIDIIRKYSLLSMKIIGFWFTSKGTTKRVVRESAVSGIFTGMGTSVTVLILVRVLQRSKSSFARILDARNLHLSVPR
ncbi:hypothetical protein MKW92_036011 [Papaver armeniacum]|nr:hypothetical protein MKW92_036011 [Papaver armeniacum]